MKNHEFDKEVRRKALEQTRSFDTESMWASVEPQLKQKKNKRRYFFFLFSGLFALAFVFAFGLLPVSESVANVELGVSPEHDITRLAGALNQEIESPSTLKSNVKPSTKTEVLKDVSKTIQEVEFKKTVAYTEIDSDVNDTKQHSNEQGRPTDLKSETTSLSKVVLVEKTANLPNTLSSRMVNNSIETKDSAPKAIVNNGPQIESIEKTNVDLNINDASIEQDLIDNERLFQSNIVYASLLETELLEFTREPLSGGELIFSKKKIKNDFPSYLGVSFAYSKISNNMKLRDGGEESVFELRNSQEKPIDAFSIAIDFTKFFSANWAFDMSLNYEKQYHKRDAITVGIGTILLQDYVVSRQVSSNGIVEQKEDVLVNNTTRYSEQTYMNFNQLGIKLGLRYAIQMRMWTIGATAGFEPQLRLSRSGLISEGIWHYDIQDDSDKIFSTDIQVNSYGSLFASYPITDRLDMDVHVNVSSPLLDRYSDSYAIQERNTLYGLRAAFKIKL